MRILSQRRPLNEREAIVGIFGIAQNYAGSVSESVRNGLLPNGREAR
jgi:hypothetical protein